MTARRRPGKKRARPRRQAFAGRLFTAHARTPARRDPGSARRPCTGCHCVVEDVRTGCELLVRIYSRPRGQGHQRHGEPHVVILLVFLGRENFYYTTLLDSTTIRQIPFDEAREHGAERPSSEIYGGVARTDGHRCG